MSGHIENEEKESNIVEQITAQYLPYWPLFILLMLLGAAAAFVYLRYATPIYQASATLIIKDDSRGGSQDSRIEESLNLLAFKKNFENEIKVLNSRALMEQVVKSLYLYAPISQEGKVKAGDAYVLSPITIEAKYPDSIQSVKKVNFSFDNNSQTVILNNKFRYPINQYVNTPYGILRFAISKYKPAASSYNKKPMFFSLENPADVVLNFSGGLNVTPNKQSAIVDINYQDPIPQRAVDIINKLINIYDQISINEKNSLARNTLAFVDEQLSQVSRELDSIENNIQRYKSGQGAVDIGAQGARFLANVSENDQKLGEINLQLSVLYEVEKFVLNRNSGELLAPSTLGLKDQALGSLLSQLQVAQIEYEKLKKTVGKNNPTLVALSDQVDKLKPAILENIHSQRISLEASKQSLNTTNSGYNSMLSVVPEKEKQLLEISREQLTKRDQYLFLLQKKQEAEMSVASVVSNSRVVDSAIASKSPVSPKKPMVYMMAVMGALGLGLGFVFLKDNLTSKIRYRNEIEKMTSIPVICEIVYEKSANPLVVGKGTRNYISEEFRKLRISLSFLGIDPSHKKLLLTSSISGEGKSFIAANLALSISLVGKKVVLVDMDLNQPTLSDILNVEYEHGVAEFLSGTAEPEEIVNKLEDHQNLYFISPGQLTDNPSELLANGRIESLINYLDDRFDMVVIDTSPAVLVTDAYLLSGLCDATLYVIRHDYTPKVIVKRIDDNIQINPLKNAAIVFNGLKTRGIVKNSYGYGHNYVYGNKYGQQGKIKKNKKAS